MNVDSQTLYLEGMSCMSCAGRIEKAVSSLSGIHMVSVDFPKRCLNMEIDSSMLSINQVISKIKDTGYKASERVNHQPKDDLFASPKELRRQLFLFPLLAGVSGTFMITALYYLALSLLNSLSFAWYQSLNYINWMIPLVIGFGIQAGIFIYMRGYAVLANSGKLSSAPIAASAGISTGSMIACCLHHVVEVLPLLGLSAAAVFLSRYQSFILAIGVASNLIGICFLMNVIQKHNLYIKGGFLAFLMKANLRFVFRASIVLSIVGVISVYYFQS